jgi:uncharacterized protein (TIRG00374 family)
MRAARLALLLCGAGLLVALLVEVGPAAVLSSFAGLSWRLPIILWFPFVLVAAFDTLGWKFAFRRDSVSFLRLAGARLAGEAFNVTTPTASVGGEPIKAWLLRPYTPLDESVPAIIVAKTTITMAQALFLLAGIAVAWPRLPQGSPLLWAMVWLLALEVIGVGGFVFVQVAGGLGAAGRILERLGLLGERAPTLARSNHALSRFYRDQPWRLGSSITCHFLGWAFSALETYVILHALGMPVSPAVAIVIEAFGTGVRFASFMVPAHLGALEGGYVATFIALALPAPLALSFTLVRRVREAAWTGIGFLALAALGSRGLVTAGAPEREG